ncbi:RidA family protein [Streptomyces sp. NBC_01622]|uniref:RidA family protein n=1 Tax=Streptomyces sp. NBC_01622 TaxID=2975903 RepID=UPI00386AA60E|nr:RidA family protein [Streptomyces sp. NBC_01622]
MSAATKSAVLPCTYAPAAGPYSPGVRKGSFLQTSGQLGLPPNSQPPVAGDAPGLRDQVRQALANVGAVLAEAGANWEDVLMVRAYLSDPADFAEFNAIYTDHLKTVTGPPPARTTVYVGLPHGLLVEIDALAILG